MSEPTRCLPPAPRQCNPARIADPDLLLVLFLSPFRRWIIAAPIFAASLFLLLAKSDHTALWSPYYYIVMSDYGAPGHKVSAPPANLRTMRDPPVYVPT